MHLTDDQHIIKSEAQRILHDVAPIAALQPRLDAGAADAALWTMLAGELGWCALGIAEIHGGLGLGAVEESLLLLESGKVLLPAPLYSVTGLTLPVLNAAKGNARGEALFAAIASGAATPVLILPQPDSMTPFAGNPPNVTGTTLSGAFAMVMDARAASHFIVPALNDLWLVEAADASITPLPSLDLTRPMARVTINAKAERLSSAPFDAVKQQKAVIAMHVMLAAEQIGAAEGAFALTLAYIKERVQFGRSIASFQAIKHRMAKMAVDLAEAHALLLHATLACAEGSVTEADALALRIAATKIQLLTASEAIQLHGGVGMTTDYAPHLYFKRAQLCANLFGSVPQWTARLAEILIEGGTAS